ncbi:DUF1843 domain-containing protein [Methylogaea oryzae]|nr:DUF1843 domain-containing protein [Methylogaea oryzae]
MHPTPLYAVTMQEAAASGDLKRMKEICHQAEEHLKQAATSPPPCRC